MSLKDLINQHAQTLILNTDHFAEAVVRHVDGSANAATDQTVNAIVTLDADPRDNSVLTRGTIDVPASTESRLRDTWTIRGELFSTVAILPADGGLKRIRIQAMKREHNSGRRTGVM